MIGFSSSMALLALAMTIPLMSMYAAKKFVGQREPPPILVAVVPVIVGLGLFVAVFAAARAMNRNGWTLDEWLILAWIVGSAVAAQVGLLETLDKD